MRIRPIRISFTKLVFPVLLAVTLAGCTTRGTFVIPEGTELEVYSRPVTVEPGGNAVMRPFAWNAAGVPPQGGVPYRLLKGGEVLQEGRLRAVFRGVSLWWPPMAIFYWPMGLNASITYDLVEGTQE